MSKRLSLWKVEAEHPKHLTNCIVEVRAATEENAVAAYRRKQDTYRVSGLGPVTDDWPIVSVTRLD